MRRDFKQLHCDNQPSNLIRQLCGRNLHQTAPVWRTTVSRYVRFVCWIRSNEPWYKCTYTSYEGGSCRLQYDDARPTMVSRTCLLAQCYHANNECPARVSQVVTGLFEEAWSWLVVAQGRVNMRQRRRMDFDKRSADGSYGRRQYTTCLVESTM